MDKEPTSAPAALTTRGYALADRGWNECGQEYQHRTNQSRSNTVIKSQVHKQQTPEPIGTVKDIRKRAHGGQTEIIGRKD